MPFLFLRLHPFYYFSSVCVSVQPVTRYRTGAKYNTIYHLVKIEKKNLAIELYHKLLKLQ